MAPRGGNGYLELDHMGDSELYSRSADGELLRPTTSRPISIDAQTTLGPFGAKEDVEYAHTGPPTNDDIGDFDHYDDTRPKSHHNGVLTYLRGKSFESWRFIVRSGALAGGVILLINLVTLIVLYTRYEIHDGAVTLWIGSCSQSSNAVLGFHLLINVLSSILLAASNNSMQCLSSPTRAEIDRAHNKRIWLSIGVPNLRNLPFVSGRKALIWLFLGISSFPLHLLWNSTIFETLAIYDYTAISATEEFLTGGAWHVDNLPSDWAEIVTSLQGLSQESKLQRLSNKDCMLAYGRNLLEDRSNLIMVVESPDIPSANESSVIAAYHRDLHPLNGAWTNWICGDNVDPASTAFDSDEIWRCPTNWIEHLASENAPNWIPSDGQTGKFLGPSRYDMFGDQHNRTIQYCLSQVKEEKCQVNAVPLFLLIVVICNIIKILGFVWTLRITQKDQPLLTTGDAIQSFLARPDPSTRSRCLVGKEEYEPLLHKSSEWADRQPGTGDLWTGGRARWGKAVRGRQWWAVMLPSATFVILAGAFFGPDGIGNGTSTSWFLVPALGIGTPQPNYSPALNSSPLIPTFISANVPQILVSYAYIAISNLLGTMISMAEWTSYGQQHKGLRVSSRKRRGEQRSTHFLTQPFRWSIPTLMFFMVLHWIVSEMYFLGRIEAYDMSGNVSPSMSVTAVFFSPLAMLIAVSLASALLFFVVSLAIFKKYPAIPLAGCCSASISAACQPSPYGRTGFKSDLTLRRLKWGVTDQPSGVYEVGHATFSDGDVVSLREGNMYS